MQARILGLRNTHRVLAAILLAAWSSGCRSDPYRDAYLEMLNAEKRVLEDRLYEAEYNYEQALAELETAQASAKDTRPPTSRTRSGNTRSDSSERPLIEPEDDGPGEIPELPTIELPPGVEEGKRKRSGAAPTVQRPSAPLVTASAVKPAKPRPLSDEELAAAIVSALDQRVETIHLNPRLTRGIDFNGQPGDDGISVLIEPRNRSGGFVPEVGRISIVLLDPSKTDEDARVARWDLDADAAHEFLQMDSLDSGLLLRLPWQDTIPDRKRLHLFVRYLTEDGRKLETDRQIEVESADMIAQRWTPRQSPSSDRTPRREATASWIPKDQTEEPVIAQTAAEEPIEPEEPAKLEEPEQPAAVTEAAASPPIALKPAPAKPLSPLKPDEATASPARNAASSPMPPTGQFWKPDR